MQTTIYYNESDSYLVKQVDAKSQRERKSRSSVILSILEEYFESEKRLGEILVDLGVISHSELAKGLELQKTRFTDKLLGDILLKRSWCLRKRWSALWSFKEDIGNTQLRDNPFMVRT